MIKLSKRIIPVVALFLIFGAVIGPTLFFGPFRERIKGSDFENETTQVERISQQLVALEVTMLARLNKIEQQMASASARSLPSEGEELRLLQEISHHASDGETQALMGSLDRYLEKFGGSQNASLIEKMRHEIAVIGKPMPKDWELKYVFQGPPDGGLGNDGLQVLLFWEEWCPHCRLEAPRMQEMYESLSPLGVNMVGLTEVNGESTIEKVYAFLVEKELDYPVIQVGSRLKNQFNVSGVPAAAIVADSQIVWRGHPARLTEELIRDMMNSES